ncbi:hypothetical protein ABZ814_19525 [Micromonospora musae]|uniref:hypothetical protein n=1 Tax=Micromonospora musae TaxID=1894970 RepID=UPI0033EAC644
MAVDAQGAPEDRAVVDPAHALQAPSEVLRERATLVRADLAGQGIDVVETAIFPGRRRPVGRIRVLLPAAGVPEAGDAGLAAILDRCGLRAYAAGVEEEAEDVLRMSLQLARPVPPDGERDWVRRHEREAEACRAALADVVEECRSRGVGVIGADVRGDVAAGVFVLAPHAVLRLRLSTAAGVGLADPAAVLAAVRRRGLLAAVRGVPVVTTSTEVGLELKSDLYWGERIRLTPRFVAERLEAVRTELAAAGAEVADQDDGGLVGRVLVHRPSWQPAVSPMEPTGLVVAVGVRGWRIRYLGPDGDEDELLDVGLAAPAAAVVDEIWPRLTWEVRHLGDPNWLMVAGTAVVASVVVPFVQALVGKAAEDAYTAVRTLIGRRLGRRLTTEPAGPAAGEVGRNLVLIRDPEAGIELIAPANLPDEAVRQLVHLDPAELRDVVLVWDGQEGRWQRASERN